MLDHGQLGPPTPAPIGVLTPVESRRPYMNDTKPRRPSVPDQLGSDLRKLSMSDRGSSKGSFSDTKAPAIFGREMSESLSMSAPGVGEDYGIEKKQDHPNVNGLAHPSSLSAQLHTHPKLAALRTAGLRTGTTPSPTLASAPPISVDPRCSGYFVETVCPYDPTPYYPLA